MLRGISVNLNGIRAATGKGVLPWRALQRVGVVYDHADRRIDFREG